MRESSGGSSAGGEQRVFSVAYGTVEFKGFVYMPHYRAQVMYHTAVACVRIVIFAATSSKKILYVVIVRAPEKFTTAYTHCMEQLLPYINWYCNCLNGTFFQEPAGIRLVMQSPKTQCASPRSLQIQ